MASSRKLIGPLVCSVIGIGLVVSIYSFWPKPSPVELKSAVTAVQKPDPNLLFSDNFDGNSLDQTKWVPCYNSYRAKYDGCTNYGNWEGEWYKPSQVAVEGGNLVLSARRQETQGTNSIGGDQKYPFVSGMVSSGALDTTSAPKFGRTYGYYEARVMIPSGQAIWPAFWLLPVGTAWPPEIDIMEVTGDKPKNLIQTFFWKNAQGNSAKDSLTYTNSTSLADNWHTYAVDWQPGTIKWFLDGKLTRQAANPNVSSTDMHIVLDLAVGGTLPGYPDATTPDEAQMLVDYVHVYTNRQAAL